MLITACQEITTAAVTKNATTTKVTKASAFPCPYGWFSSAGFAEYFNPKRTKVDAKMSVVDSIASAIRA